MISAHDALRLLAEDLARRGFAVLRFDYPGTGDSADVAGTDDLVPSWLRGITAGICYLRTCGCEHVVVVGMRMGATLAALAVAGQPVDAAVLWDPCMTGRVFLRQQTALSRLLVASAGRSSEPGPDVEIPGYVYSRGTATHVSQLSLQDAPHRLADATLVLVRGKGAVSTVTAQFEQHGLTVERVDGQPELLDVSSVALEIPHTAVNRISTWMSNSVTATSRSVIVAASQGKAIVDADRDLTEDFVHLGPLGLFGIRTQPARPTDLPIIVFLNSANEVHIGPARQWVELARGLAAHGFPSVRVDLSGLGDSPARPGEAPRQAYGPYLLSDVRDVMDAVAGEGPANLILLGLCSGAYAALTAGASLGARGVIAISPILDIRTGALWVDPTLEADGYAVLSPARPRNRHGVTLLRNDTLKGWVSRLPPFWWRLAHALHLQRSPADGLAMVVERVGDTLVICNAHDARPFLDRGGWIVNRLNRTGRFRLETVEVDHSLLERQGRREVAECVVSHLLARYVGSDTSTSSPSGVWAVRQENAPQTPAPSDR